MLERIIRTWTILLSICASPTEAKSEFPSGKGQYRIVLIGVNGYEHTSPLTLSVADVQRIGRTLGDRGGVAGSYQFLEMTDGMPDDLKPTRANILKKLPEFLRASHDGDTILFFYSGHGFQADDGRTFLAPIDCDPARLDTTGVSLATVRELLDRCRASTKFCVIDACHSGAAKGGPGEVTAAITDKAVEKTLGEAAGVYTLASCKGGELSIEWADKRQGLFTYWLCRGLEGAADENGNWVIEADELHHFVHDHVIDSAKELRHSQTPVRIVGPDVAGSPAVYVLRPEKVQGALRRLADLLHEQVKASRVARIAVLTFKEKTGVVQANGGIGPFSVTAADRLEQELTGMRQDAYAVASRNVIETAMIDSGGPLAYGRLAERVPTLDAVLKGEFHRLAGPDRIRVACQLIKVRTGDVLASVSAMISVDDDLWLLLGGPFYKPSPSDDPPPVWGVGQTPFYVSPSDFPTSSSAGEHPLKKRDFPFGVQVIASGRVKELTRRRDGGLVFGATPGETYEIRIENRTDRRVMVKVLVDGINSLAQSDTTPGLSHVFLDEARGWVVSPDSKVSIAGWYRKTTPPIDLRRFQVDDPERSVAASLGFIKDVGQITVAFYAESTSSPPSPTPLRTDLSGVAFRKADEDQKQRAETELTQKATRAVEEILTLKGITDSPLIGVEDLAKIRERLLELARADPKMLLQWLKDLQHSNEKDRARLFVEFDRNRLRIVDSPAMIRIERDVRELGTREGPRVQGASLPPIVSFSPGRLIFGANIHYVHKEFVGRE